MKDGILKQAPGITGAGFARGVVQAGIGRWIYLLTAMLFVLVTMAGFIPTSIEKIEAVALGQRPPFLPMLHVHAAVMGSWLLLLLAQTRLVAAGRQDLHRRLGMAGGVVAVAVIVTGVIVAVMNYALVWNPAFGAPSELKEFVSNILLLQIRALLLFVAFIGWGLLVRRRDSETHKRLMLLATVVPLQAAVDRLCVTLGITAESVPSYMLVNLVLAVPVLAWDITRYGHLHRSTAIWLGASLASALVVFGLWSSPWWLTNAPRLMGVE